MKRLLFFLFLCSNVLYAQKMPQTLQQVAQWQAVNTAKDSVFLWHFSFGEGSTETELALKMLENQRITRIQLVYTKYSSVKKFDQAALNQRRLEKMYALHPEWFDTQNGIVWEMVEQTGCNSNASCEGFFHGFAIYYMTALAKKTAKPLPKNNVNELYSLRINEIRNNVPRAQEEGAFQQELLDSKIIINRLFIRNITDDYRDDEVKLDSASAKVVKKLTASQETPEQEAQRAIDFETLVDNAPDEDDVALKPENKTIEKPTTTDSTASKTITIKGKTAKQSTTVKKIKTPKQKRIKQKNAKKRIKKMRKIYTGPTKFSKNKRKKWVNTQEYNAKVDNAYFSYWKKLMKIRDDDALELWSIYIKNRDCLCFPEICTDTLIPPDTLQCKSCKHNRIGFQKPVYEYEGSVPEAMQRLYQKYSRFNIVSDVTKGMVLPNVELFIWSNQESHFKTFFNGSFYNDGDKRADTDKPIGTTGGIYTSKGYRFIYESKYAKTTAFDRLLGTACRAINSGNGGEIATENAIEALLKAEDTCKVCDATVLIADNRSPIRDMVLAKQLKTPIRIIAVYATKEKGLVNTDYLDLAYMTKGSVHTRTADYPNIATMKNAETLQIMDYTYMLKNGKFVCIRAPQ
jgi:hypothetical protein